METAYHIRENAEDYKKQLKELLHFTEAIKEKEQKQKQLDRKFTAPIRNSLPQTYPQAATKKHVEKIKGFDYKSWDAYDAEAAATAVDKEDSFPSIDPSQPDTSSVADQQEDLVEKSLIEKESGNAFFKKGEYLRAIKCYSKAMKLDPTNPILPINRAFAYIKTSKFQKAENDCSTALSLDNKNVKSFWRRGLARIGLEKYQEAKEDLELALVLEPTNKTVREDLERVEAILNPTKNKADKPLRKRKLEVVLIDKDDEPAQSLPKIVEIVGEEPKKTIEPKITEIFEDEEPEKAVEPKITEIFEDEQPGNAVSVSTEEPKITETTKEPIVVKIAQSASDPQKDFCSKPIDVVKGSVKVNQNIREHSPSPTEEANPVVKQPTLVEATSKPIIKSESQQTTPAKVVPSKPIPIPKSAIPNIPTTMYDFEKNWKTVKNDNVLLYSWFKKIEPTAYQKLFGNLLESHYLITIFSILLDFYIPSKEFNKVVQVLLNISKIPRFEMSMMFLNKKEKSVILDIIKALQVEDVEGVDEVIKKYI